MDYMLLAPAHFLNLLDKKRSLLFLLLFLLVFQCLGLVLDLDYMNMEIRMLTFLLIYLLDMLQVLLVDQILLQLLFLTLLVRVDMVEMWN